MNSAPIWLLDDDASIRFVLSRALQKQGFEVRCFETISTLSDALSLQTPALLITDIHLSDGNGLSLLQQTSAQGLPVIVMTAYGDLDKAVAAFQGGAFEYLTKPFDLQALAAAVQAALSRSQSQAAEPLSQGDSTARSHAGMVGRSSVMQQLFRQLGRLSATDVNVLISGETGVGKELVARALHDHSPRRSGPFVAINSAAIPAELLESELFGHEKGAFTGATQRREGRFEQAQGGTLFLDEIGDMPLPLQSRLLRVLAEGDYYRVGGHEALQANVRIIAASHQDLRQRVAEHHFRADLYHRLNVVQLRVPPLRERRDDIPLLVQHFLNQAAQQLGLELKQVDDASMQLLQQAQWPGNIRELKNLCQQLLIMAPGELIVASDLPAEMLSSVMTNSEPSPVWRALLRQEAHSQFESAANTEGELVQLQQDLRELLVDVALKQHQGRIGAAAQSLGLGRNTLARWIKQINAQRGS
jgi:two-component system nitrogen regulation response regulator GlnG